MPHRSRVGGAAGPSLAQALARRISVAALTVGVLACADARRAEASDPAPNGLAGTFGQSDAKAQVVSSTGAMTYSVPFNLPEARGTAQPTLGVHYSSSAGVGEAGGSWSLGLPSIERAPLSGFPKYADPASYSDISLEDRYTYGGRPLTYICGGPATWPACPPPTGESGEAIGPTTSFPGYFAYRLQVEGSFERFFLTPDRTTWIVQRRGGEVLELGAPLTRPELTPNAPAYDREGTKVFRWNVSRQRDLHGTRNVIVYRC